MEPAPNYSIRLNLNYGSCIVNVLNNYEPQSE